MMVIPSPGITMVAHLSAGHALSWVIFAGLLIFLISVAFPVIRWRAQRRTTGSVPERPDERN